MNDFICCMNLFSRGQHIQHAERIGRYAKVVITVVYHMERQLFGLDFFWLILGR